MSTLTIDNKNIQQPLDIYTLDGNLSSKTILYDEIQSNFDVFNVKGGAHIINMVNCITTIYNITYSLSNFYLYNFILLI